MKRKKRQRRKTPLVKFKVSKPPKLRHVTISKRDYVDAVLPNPFLEIR